MTWPYHYTPYIWPMAASSALMWAFALYAWRHRTTPGVVPFTFGTLIMGLWALGAAGEPAGSDFPTKLFWFRVQNASGVPVVICMLCFALEYSGLGGWINRRSVAFLVAPAVAIVPLYFVDDSRILVTRIWAGETIHRTFAPVGVALNLYGMGLLLLATVVIVVLFVRSPLHRVPAALILSGHLGPSVTYPLEALNLVPDSSLDLTVLAADFTFLMYTIAMYRFRIFDVVPVARETVLERMVDGMVVVDAQDRIADLNPAAVEMLGVPRSRVIGRDAEMALGGFAGLAQLLRDPAPAQAEVLVDTTSGKRWYGVGCSPLADRRGFRLGRLMVLHDITEIKRAQERVLQQQRALAAVQERERVARELHDGVGQVLGYVSLQAEAARKLVEDGRAADADAQLARLADVARDAHTDVRGDILALRAAAFGERGFFPALSRYLEGFSENYGVRTALSVPPGLENGEFEPEAQVQLFRILQEALSNARKHGGAGHVQVTFEAGDGLTRIVIQDDGKGFDPAGLPKEEGARFGLQFMRERAEQVGGSVEVRSAPGEGTRVVVHLPLRARTED